MKLKESPRPQFCGQCLTGPGMQRLGADSRALFSILSLALHLNAGGVHPVLGGAEGQL